MNISEKDITSYIEHLIKNHNLYISIHGDIAKCKQLVQYNFHLHPLCNYIKTRCSCWEICVNKQDKLKNKLKDGAFFGTCYAGMGEYVYPIKYYDNVVGFISISGYLGNDKEVKEKQMHFSKKYNTNYEALAIQTKKLNYPPDIDEFDFLIKPLVLMCEQFYANEFSYIFDKGDLISSIIQYVHLNHTYKCTTKSLCENFHCSVSYLSHLFKKNTGKSLPEYIEDLRINDAKRLLKESNLSIIEISEILGFCNSAYFTSVFKKHLGVSPLKYKREI